MILTVAILSGPMLALGLYLLSRRLDEKEVDLRLQPSEWSGIKDYRLAQKQLQRDNPSMYGKYAA